MENYKSLLQNHYAGKNDLPIYKTVSAPSESLTPRWLCKLTTPDGVFESYASGKKKNAEQMAAKLALEYINEEQNKSPMVLDEMYSSMSSTVILVDIENQSNLPKFSKDFPKNIPVIAFGSIGSPILEIIRNEMPNVEIVEVPSTRQNSADIGLCIAVTKYVIDQTYDHIIILSNDKFSGVVVDCVNNNFLNCINDIKIDWYRNIHSMLRNL